MKVLAPCVSIGPLGNADQGNIVQSETSQHLAGDGELPGAAVDKDEVGPVRKRAFVQRFVIDR
jgi:hypothetical protein